MRKLLVLVVPWLVLGCVAPPAGFKNSPWTCTTESGWRRAPQPGAFLNGTYYANTYSRESVWVTYTFTGIAYIPYGAWVHIAKCEITNGQIASVEFVPWRLGAERMATLREWRPLW